MDREKIEKTKVDFSVQPMLDAREKTQKAVSLIAARVVPGMLEEEGRELADQILSELGSNKRWHRSWVRFGENTLKHYGIPSTPNVRLKENDIFFLDVGPIWNGYEADFGQTFTVGNNLEMDACVNAARELFDRVKAYWENSSPSGHELYRYAAQEAESIGYPLHLEQANGHRLGDFPHAIHYKGSIASLEFSPSRHLWVLEIQIKHPRLPFGAFVEDLLV